MLKQRKPQGKPRKDKNKSVVGVHANKGRAVASKSAVPVNMIMTDKEVENVVAEYEHQYGMSSDEFLRRRMMGDVPDSFETMHWYVLLRNR